MTPPQPLALLTKTFLVSGLLLLAVIFLVQGAGVLIPVAIALLVWFLLNAMANGYRRFPIIGRLIPRSLALILSLGTVILIGVLVLDMVVRTVSDLATRTSDFQHGLNPVIDRIGDKLGLSNKEVLNRIADSIGIERLLGLIVAEMASFASQFGVIVIYVIFLMIDQQFFDMKLEALVRDEKRRTHIRGILRRVAHGIQGYLSVMTLVSGLTAGLSYAVMLWIGLEHTAFWAIIIFMLNFIPTIGSFIGTLLPATFALMQFQEFKPFFILLASIGLIQFVMGNILQPRLAGNKLNMSHFVIILSLFVWGAIWGVTGMFLAVPIMAILMITFSNFEATRPWAVLLSQSGRVEQESK